MSTSIWGNDNGGGGSGPNGHRVIITYDVSQNILSNYSDVSWQVGIDYGDPNYWNNIRNRTYAFALNTGASISAVAGSLSGSDSTIINTSDPGYGGQIHYFYSGTARVYHNGSGAGIINMQASAMFNGTYTSSINQNVTLPTIQQNPTAPSGVTSVRVNDTQATISWTNNSSGTATWASIKVYRATDGGGFALIATISSNPTTTTSYSDTSIVANHKYQYKVSAVGQNTAESSQTAAAAAVFTTPAADSSVTAAKIAGGDIQVTWTVNSNYKSNSDLQHDIFDSPDGTTWNYQATVFGATATWTHVAPSTAVTHRYRINTFPPPANTLIAQSNVSNIITLLATANAPTALSPITGAKDATEAIVFTWTHNPADGTAQTKYQLQYKIDAGSFVTVGPTTSGVSSYTLPASTLTNGHTITWHVATAGQNGTIGAYSSDQVFTTAPRPTSTINSPSGGVWNTSLATVNWTVGLATQASWHGYLYRVDAGPTYVQLEDKVGTTETSTVFATPLTNGVTYAARIYVTSTAGLTSIDSGTELETFTATFFPPAAVTLSTSYNDTDGSMLVTCVGSAAVASVQALVLDGSGDYGTTADSAALDVTGDLDMRADIQPSDWTPATMVGIIEKWIVSGNQRSYALALDTAGKLRMRISTDGTTITEAVSSVAVGATDGSRLSVRAARVGSTVTFYTSPDADLSAATWFQLGTTQTLSGTIFASTAILNIGSNGSGAYFLGNIYAAQVRGTSGTIVAYPTYDTQAAGTTSFSDGVSNTWTLVGNAVISTIIPGTVAIATVDLQRQVDGGDWITWAAGVVLPSFDLTAILVDRAPSIHGVNAYRALVYSATPSSAFSATVTNTTTEQRWCYLSTGVSFDEVVRMRARVKFKATVGRRKAKYQFAGRAKPVEMSTEFTSRSVGFQGTLYGTSATAQQVEAIGDTDSIVLFRDFSGRRWFCSLSDVDVDYDTDSVLFPVAFTVEQVDYKESWV